MRPHDRKRRLKRHHAKLQQQQEESARAENESERSPREKGPDDFTSPGSNKR